ncbi:MAG TPA: glycerol kinase GlpK [Gaiellaceae bacterium]|nr:glycerol kinase GlpK [Gaiellaceae bacterium]
MILAIDQGTTGTTCLLVDEELTVHGRGYAELPQHFPRPGWVEHDPEEIWESVERAREGLDGYDAIAITNQRETSLLWDRRTGEPVQRAIVWQDRRTAERCAQLDAGLIRAKTGLVPDPYFSATKLEWLLREHGTRDGLAFGTVDTWLVWRLTNGEVHATDETNAARTMLCNLETLDWDGELLDLFGVPRELLPEIRPSGAEFGAGVRGVAGDQQAALFAAGGAAKATYGTGAFVLVETEDDPGRGVLRTAAARLAGEQPRRALEGAVFVTGAAVQWLRDGLAIVDDAHMTEELALSVRDNGGVYFVPALTGLGSPHWRADARGLVTGLTRGTTHAHFARAALEATAYQVRDVLEAMPPVELLRADGGMTRNRWLMQFQADVLGVPVETAREPEQTAFGAALLALGERRASPAGERFEPRMSRDQADSLYAGWQEAVRRVLA